VNDKSSTIIYKVSISNSNKRNCIQSPIS